MYDHLQRIGQKLEISTERIAGTDENGKKLEILVMRTGIHTVIAHQRTGCTELAYIIDLPTREAASLAKQPMDVQEKLFAIVRLEMMEGRSGFEMIFDRKKTPPELRRISIVQRIVIDDELPQTAQRVADGIQEIIVVGSRCRVILGQAFEDARAAAETTLRTYHPGMYV